MNYKSDIGELHYKDDGNTGPHAVTQIDWLTDRAKSLPDHKIVYTSFNKVKYITEGPNYKDTMHFVYGPEYNRKTMTYKKDGDLQYTRYYSGNCEKTTFANGNERKVYYISGGDGLAAAWVKENGTTNLYYIHTDHLGSICAITDEGQNVVANYSFDAWGNRRDPDTWELTDTRDESFTARGFTGHEHIDEFGLINMNGRVYDPTIGQFLSPDNYVQLPDYSLGFNRYSYALNNPLVYTDPSGELIWMLPAGALLFVGGHILNDQVAAGNISPYWSLLGYSMIGGGTMMMGMGMGAVPGLAAPAMAESFLGGSIFYGGTSYLSNYAFNMTFNNMSSGEASKSAALSSILPAAIGGFKGGLTALANDKNFWWGTEVAGGRSQWSLINNPTLEYKLDVLVDKNMNELSNTIGEAGVKDVYLGTRQNLKGTNYTNAFGELYGPEGQVAGFTTKGDWYSSTFDNYSKFNNNKIFLSKNTVRRMYRGVRSARETLFHEWFHARDYYTGWAAYFNSKYGASKTRDLLEFRAHYFNYNRYPSLNRYNQMLNYSKSFWGL